MLHTSKIMRNNPSLLPCWCHLPNSRSLQHSMLVLYHKTTATLSGSGNFSGSPNQPLLRIYLLLSIFLRVWIFSCLPQIGWVSIGFSLEILPHEPTTWLTHPGSMQYRPQRNASLHIHPLIESDQIPRARNAQDSASSRKGFFRPVLQIGIF